MNNKMKTLISMAARHMTETVKKEAMYSEPTPWTLYPIFHEEPKLPKHLRGQRKLK